MKRKSGFTLVELNLAMVFIAILLIGVTMTTIYITRIYQKGSTIKTINQIGREVSEQLRRDMSAAVPSSVQVVETANGSGRLCLGTVSYVYNTPAALESGDRITIDGDAMQPVYLVRIQDGNAAWCNGTKNQVNSVSDEYTELLTNDILPLAVHALGVDIHTPTSGDQAVTQQLYALTMQLGTNEDKTVNGGECLPPTSSESNFDYCFIAEFNTIIRAGELAK